MEAPVTFQSKNPAPVSFFTSWRKRAREASPSAKQNPGDNLKKFWKMIVQSLEVKYTV